MLTQDIMEAIGHELRFWKEFVQTPRFLRGWVDDSIKTPELQQDIYEYITKMPGFKEKKVLDIGSGAVSILNGTFPKDNITAIDPLGSLYSLVFDYEKYGIRPPICCGGEAMNFVNQFDIVHCSNAIDHTQDPMTVYRNMHRACRSGGIVIIQSFIDEAVHENWEGFHQWNFRVSDIGKVSFSNRHGKEFHLPGEQVYFNFIKDHLPGKDFFISAWKKTGYVFQYNI